MTAAVRAEWRKLVSTRLWWVLAILMFAYLVFIAAMLAISFTVEVSGAAADQQLGGVEAALTSYSVVSPIGYVFPLIMGSLLVTTEFRHHTITETLLVQPARGAMLGAKLVVAAVVGLAYGVVGTAAVLVGAAPLLGLRGDGAGLGNHRVLAVLTMSILVLGIWAGLGAAFGALVRNQVAAIIAIVAFTQFVEPIARIGLAAVGPLAPSAKFLPGAAADGAVGYSFFNQTGTLELLDRWQGLLVLLAYVAIFAVAARLTTLRRDIG